MCWCVNIKKVKEHMFHMLFILFWCNSKNYRVCILTCRWTKIAFRMKQIFSSRSYWAKFCPVFTVVGF